METTIFASLTAAIASAVIVYFFTTHIRSKKIASSQSGDDHVLDLRLDQAFQKGKEAGRTDELAKFTLTYEPFVETVEEYLGLKKRSTLGYDMQIHYAGFPIGHKTRYITHQNIEYDEKRVDALLNNDVTSAINGVVQLAVTKGMGAKTLPPRKKTN